MIRVAVVDEQALVRAGLRLILERQADIAVVGEGASGEDAVRLAAELAPDVLLLEACLPGTDGLEATREIGAAGGPTRVLVVTRLTGEDLVVRLMRAGAAGYLGKSAAPADLITAVREVHRGQIYLAAGFQASLLARFVRPRGKPGQGEEALSDREFQVLSLLARGETHHEIAARLGVGVKTVDTHRSNLLRKLCLRNNSDLTRFALRRGLVDG